MTKRPSMRRKTETSALPPKPFVVYVTFPSGGKEYAYLCKDPLVRQGSWVIANGTDVQVRRTASHDPLASKYVMTAVELDLVHRKGAIVKRLEQIERSLAQRDRWTALAKRDPEARRLLKELESLT